MRLPHHLRNRMAPFNVTPPFFAVLSGAFNFTRAADEKNAENLLVIHDVRIAAKDEENSQSHFGSITPAEGLRCWFSISGGCLH